MKRIYCIKYVFVFWVTTFTILSCSSPVTHFRTIEYTYSKPNQLDDNLKTANLSDVGLDSSKIIELTKLILSDSFPNIHSLLIFKNNQLAYENYFAGYDQISGKNLGYIQHNIDDLHDCRSISKSVVSACVGIALKKGLIKSIDDPMFKYLPEYEKFKTTDNAKITIRHLLTMSSGFDWNETSSYSSFSNSEFRMDISFNPIKYVLKRSIATEPGTHWNYCGGNTQLLAQIIQNVSGLKIDAFAQKHLFAPLGIKKYTWLGMVLRKSIPASFSGLRLRSRDFAKFGLLYMNNGIWCDSIILEADWATASLTEKIPRLSSKNIKRGGYGYQFWTYTDTIKNNSIEISEAKGNGGNAIFYCKSLNLLVVITAGNYNKWDIVNNSHEALVKYIIPSVK